MPIIVMAVLWIPAYLLLRHTTFGRALYAVGANLTFATGGHWAT
jgi:ribose/xylose/arabinose/galactoside ABC-type transport system permease subunit